MATSRQGRSPLTKKTLVTVFRASMIERAMTKGALAKKLRTSRAAVDRILDASNKSITLRTVERTARALGLRVTIEATPLPPRRLGELGEKLAEATTPDEIKTLRQRITAGFYGSSAQS